VARVGKVIRFEFLDLASKVPIRADFFVDGELAALASTHWEFTPQRSGPTQIGARPAGHSEAPIVLHPISVQPSASAEGAGFGPEDTPGP
jgi:hypothetical protein